MIRFTQRGRVYEQVVRLPPSLTPARQPPQRAAGIHPVGRDEHPWAEPLAQLIHVLCYFFGVLFTDFLPRVFPPRRDPGSKWNRMTVLLGHQRRQLVVDQTSNLGGGVVPDAPVYAPTCRCRGQLQREVCESVQRARQLPL